MRWIVMGMLVVVILACAYLGVTALLESGRSDAARAADTAVQVEAYRTQQARLAAEAESARSAQAMQLLQANETARLAYLNTEAEGRRAFYAYLVAAGTITPEAAARALLQAGPPDWLKFAMGAALGIVLTLLALATWLRLSR